MSTPTFTARKYTFIQIALWLTLVMVPGVTLGQHISDWFEHSWLSWTFDTGRMRVLPASAAAPGADAQLSWGGQVHMNLHNPSASDRLTAMLPSAAVSALVMTASAVLLRLVDAAQRGRPFAPASVGGIRLLGALAVVGGVVVPLANGYADSRLADRALAEPIGFEAHFPFAWFVAAGLLFALAEVFRVGNRLEAEVEGLV